MNPLGDSMEGNTHLILIRHAETDWNAELRFQGHSDTPLNESGRAAIPRVIEALRPMEPVVIYTSDLLRASQMAEAAGEVLGIEVIPGKELRECDYGSWEGKTMEEVRRDHEGELDAWYKDEAGYARGGGESLEEMQERAWAWINSIAGAHPGETVALFTHSGPVRGAVCRIFDLGMVDRYRFQVENASISVLSRHPTGEWQVVLLNQTSHLQH